MGSEDVASHSIQGDVPCVGCGYNLRTLARNGVCPECGLDVQPSLDADRLRRTELGYLRAKRLPWLYTARRGVNAAFAAWVLCWLGCVLGFLPDSAFQFDKTFRGCLFLLPFMSVFVLSTFAAWRLAGLLSPRPRLVMRLTAAACIISVGLCFLNYRWVWFYKPYVNLERFLLTPALMKIAPKTGETLSIVWPIATTFTFCLFIWIAWLAQRKAIAILLGLHGLAAIGWASLRAWVMLRFGGLSQFDTSVEFAVFLVGPTGTMPMPWIASAYGIKHLGEFAQFFFADPKSTAILALLGLLCLAGGIVPGLLLKSLRRTLTRAIRLSESPEASSRT